MRFVVFAVCWAVLSNLSSACLAADFPYRGNYPEIAVVELRDLKAGYDSGDFIIIDVRSKAEFDVIHIKNAISVPYSNATFTKELRTIVRGNPGRKIAVYCNGIDCIKSYKAAEDALYAQIGNVFAFDAGIAVWAQTYPGATMLQGKELDTPGQKLFPEEKFNKACLDYDAFKVKADGTNAVVIDARDPIQRKHKLPGMDKAMPIPMDKLVQNVIRKGNMKDKELYIFDQVGRQVNWLMYYLVQNDYSDFYFLRGGATAVLQEQEYR